MPEHTNGTTISIDQADGELPANDLVYQGQVVNPEQAWQLHQSGTDLSQLNPDASTDLWKGPSSAADSVADGALPIPEWGYVNYLSNICSSSGIFRFNVGVTPPAGVAQTLTVMLSKDLHTFLLRKELLRRLGYKVPAMKYLHAIKVEFPDVTTRNLVLKQLIPDATDGAANRWCSVAAESLKADSSIPCTAVSGMTGADLSPTTVWFQDVLAMEATPLYYNLALGPPIQVIPGTANLSAEGPRILRALAVAYDLVDVPESINQFDWYAARTNNGTVTFSVQDQANFAATFDDALWMVRRIANLTRDDVTQIVAASQYPAAISPLLVEKIAARRNSLVAAFGTKEPGLAVNSKVSAAPAVVNGKVIQKDWYGYASRFAFGDPQSPLRGLGWFFTSIAESNGLEALVDKANAEIPALNQTAAAESNAQDLTQQALEKYFQTGQVQSVPFGVWVAPVVSGGLQLSRSIVMGEYLGTNNLIQLADTFGFQATAGLIVGVNGLPGDVSVQGLVEGNASISVTHLMPLTALKQAVTTPVSKLLVPLVFADASNVFRQISALQNKPNTTPAQLKTALANDVDSLKNYLNVGESLILTESLTGLQQLSAAIASNIPITPTLDGSIGVDEIVVSRLHFYRKDQNTIQVFKDGGELVGVQLSLEFTVGTDVAAFPVASITAQSVTGSAHSSVYTINLYPDPVANPGIFASAVALASALRTGSTETIEALQRPLKVAVDFSDRDSTLQFFFLVHRTLKSKGTVQVELPDGTSGKYLSLSDGSQSGDSFQSLATQAATFLVQQLSGSITYSVDTQVAPNPGQTFLGSSHTRQVSLQARLSPGISTPYFQAQYRWEGWSMKAADLQALVDQLSKQYGFQLYPAGFEGNMQKIQLYEVTLVVSLYQAALNQIGSMSTAALAAFEKQYGSPYHCELYQQNNTTSLTPAQLLACGQLNEFDYQMGKYHSDTDPAKQGQDLMEAVSELEQFMAFPDLVNFVGGIQNVYVSSQITGFRVGSETLSQPINSNTLGQADATNPSGILSSVEQLLGVDDGEFEMQWLRDVL